ncbi:Aste57867_20170 [Aphanomyces stellatus]|uniref:Aste57867_20170 protein n=1 Tax=Aphanomyces stellatus TaxID=120398 RepID=A0A485LEI8_9STRA|nr:hypothetical protein As57867_020104 [Aphanomyces stellatus]VFT96864.1 Aste57867_20170 [Aphanomyces stellatus]
MFYISTVQWVVVSAVVGDAWTPSSFSAYATICVVQGAGVVAAFFLTFTGREIEVPHLDPDSPPLDATAVLACWDLIDYLLRLHPTKTAIAVVADKPICV